MVSLSEEIKAQLINAGVDVSQIEDDPNFIDLTNRYFKEHFELNKEYLVNIVKAFTGKNNRFLHHKKGTSVKVALLLSLIYLIVSSLLFYMLPLNIDSRLILANLILSIFLVGLTFGIFLQKN